VPPYSWCCLSCGEINGGVASACTACACPASATVEQLVGHRQVFVASGGALQPGATTIHERRKVSEDTSEAPRQQAMPAMKQPHNGQAPVTPFVALLLAVCMAGLCKLCEHLQASFFITVVILGAFATLTIVAVARASKPGGWLSDDLRKGERPSVGYVSGSALHEIFDPEPPEAP